MRKSTEERTERAGWREGWAARLASWAGLGDRGPGGAVALAAAATASFLFLKTEIETVKLRKKREELEHKENTLQLLELSTILINCIGHF